MITEGTWNWGWVTFVQLVTWLINQLGNNIVHFRNKNAWESEHSNYIVYCNKKKIYAGIITISMHLHTVHLHLHSHLHDMRCTSYLSDQRNYAIVESVKCEWTGPVYSFMSRSLGCEGDQGLSITLCTP